MIPYNMKLWKHHPKEMTCDWLDRFVPKPDLKRVIQGAISNDGGALGYNSYFYYPREGGIDSLVRSLTDGLSNIHVCQEVNRISLNPRVVYTGEGEAFPFDVLVSTMPLKELIKAIDNKPKSVKEAARKLKYVSLLNINFGINGKIAKKHWVYIPEKHLIFYRIGFPFNFSAKTVPPGYSSIYTEISYNHRKGIDHDWAKEKVIADLRTMGLIKGRSEIIAEKVIDIPFAYVIYDSQREQFLSQIGDFLKREGIFSAGRYGAWKYSTMEDAVLDGRKIAAAIAKRSLRGLNSNSKEMEIGGIV
jgi:protoporphyrinogen oxidase